MSDNKASMSRDTDPQARDKLERLAGQLDKLRFPSSPISPDLSDYAAKAIKRFLSGESKNLDEAFGAALSKCPRLVFK
jgi:hypothetical protein